MGSYQVLPPVANPLAKLGTGFEKGIGQGIGQNFKSSLLKEQYGLKSQLPGKAVSPDQELKNRIAKIKMAVLDAQGGQGLTGEDQGEESPFDVFGMGDEEDAGGMTDILGSEDNTDLEGGYQPAASVAGQYAPGMSQDEVVKKIMGLSTPKPKTATRQSAPLPETANEITQRAYSNIKTSADAQDLIDNKEAYAARGVDVDSILSTLGVPGEAKPTDDGNWFQKALKFATGQG